VAASAWTDSWSRAAALPVGAASATRGDAPPPAAACSQMSATIRATVVVLPVPGPPATTDQRWVTAVAAACDWRPAASGPNRRDRPSASRPELTAVVGGEAIARGERG